MKEVTQIIKYTCDYCGKVFENGFYFKEMAIETIPYDSEIEIYDKHFCSRKCLGNFSRNYLNNGDWFNERGGECSDIVSAPKNW